MQCVQHTCLVILTVLGAARTAERSVVVSKKSEKSSSDQATSGSEYSFTMHSDGPAEYEAYKNANYNPSSEHYGMPPVIPDIHSAVDDVLPESQPGYITHDNRFHSSDSGNFHYDYEHHYPYHTDYHLPIEMMSKSYGSDVPVTSYGLPISFSVNDYPYTLSQSHKGLEFGYPRAPGYHGPSNYGSNDAMNYIKDFGKRYGESQGASQGERGENGFQTAQEFDKGSRGNFQNEGQQKSYNEKGGTQSGHFDAAGHYANQNQASKQHEGGSFSEDKGHNKGSKTTGYHKVFYKDEYKKDHEFYDESDRKGKFEKYGNKQVQQSGNSGEFNKGGRHDSGYQNQQAGAAGFSNKGQSVDEDSRYNKVTGNQQFNQNSAGFGRKSGESETEVNGFKEGNRFGY